MLKNVVLTIYIWVGQVQIFKLFMTIGNTIRLYETSQEGFKQINNFSIKHVNEVFFRLEKFNVVLKFCLTNVATGHERQLIGEICHQYTIHVYPS